MLCAALAHSIFDKGSLTPAAMFAKFKDTKRRIKQEVLQAAGLAERTVDPVLEAKFARFVTVEANLEGVNDAMGALFTAQQAVAVAERNLSASLRFYHDAATVAQLEVERDNSSSSSSSSSSSGGAEGSTAEGGESRKAAAMDACAVGLNLCDLLDAHEARNAPLQQRVLRELLLRPTAGTLGGLAPVRSLMAQHRARMVQFDAARREADALARKREAAGGSEPGRQPQAAEEEAAARLHAADAAVKDVAGGLTALLDEVDAKRPFLLSGCTAALFASRLDGGRRQAALFEQATPRFIHCAGPLAAIAEMAAGGHSTTRGQPASPSAAAAGDAQAENAAAERRQRDQERLLRKLTLNSNSRLHGAGFRAPRRAGGAGAAAPRLPLPRGGAAAGGAVLPEFGLCHSQVSRQMSLGASATLACGPEPPIPPHGHGHGEQALPSSSSARKVVVAKHEYTGQEAGDLHFGQGEHIEVMKETASGWWRGKIGERVGVFPVNFTVPIEDLPPA